MRALLWEVCLKLCRADSWRDSKLKKLTERLQSRD